ncbi:MAG: hypothetical protein PUP91_05905 [Rhizonema sp. PD37]|nr:hypothetical protein [Rhizonema sp. PD37]
MKLGAGELYRLLIAGGFSRDASWPTSEQILAIAHALVYNNMNSSHSLCYRFSTLWLKLQNCNSQPGQTVILARINRKCKQSFFLSEMSNED